MPSQKLNDKALQGLKFTKSGQVDVWDSVLRGLAVRVGRNTKTFFVGTRVSGKYRRITVGSYPAISLADARKRAGEIINDAQSGVGPELRKKREAKGTFGAVAKSFMTDYASKHRSRREMQRKINRELAVWHDRQISEITRADIKELLRVKARTAPIMANRLKALISKIFTWALKEEIINSSPAMSLDMPGGSERDRQRERNLSADEIRVVWAAFDKLPYPYGPAFKLLLITGQRRSEVGGMRWSEITEEGWRIPNERTKRGKGHLVPLSSLAWEILTELPRRGDCVFGVTSRHDTPPQAWSRAKEQIGAVIDDWHTHDLRRTFATQLRKLGVDRLVVSKLLNHAEAGITFIYDRYSADPEKAAAMERWANRLREIISGEPAGNVVPMRISR